MYHLHKHVFQEHSDSFTNEHVAHWVLLRRVDKCHWFEYCVSKDHSLDLNAREAGMWGMRAADTNTHILCHIYLFDQPSCVKEAPSCERQTSPSEVVCGYFLLVCFCNGTRETPTTTRWMNIRKTDEHHMFNCALSSIRRHLCGWYRIGGYLTHWCDHFWIIQVIVRQKQNTPPHVCQHQ